MNGDHRDLGLGLLINLFAQAAHRLRRCGIDNTGKIVDVTRGMEFLDGLSAERGNQAGQGENPWQSPPDFSGSHAQRL